MKAKYIRVSTLEQNIDRQAEKGLELYIDHVSGSTPFKERTAAKRLLNDIDKGIINEVQVHSIDRLGRNTLDIMQTIELLTSKGINVISKKEGLQTLVDGKVNPVSKLMIGILGTLAEFELTRSKERQAEGIAKAKAKGVYVGRNTGSVESKETTLNKAKNTYIANQLSKGFSMNSIRMKTKDKFGTCSINTVRKIKELMSVYSVY